MHTTIELNHDWRFALQGDALIPFTAAESDFSDDDWRRVDLPHDWGVEGSYDHQAPGGNRYGFLPSGIAWYRRALQVEADWLDGRIELCFEGVYRNSDVYINGQHVGHRAMGWIAFRYEISKHLQTGRNIIAVRVDNSRQPGSRWYTGSGINRTVSLCLTPQAHLVSDGLVVQQAHDLAGDTATLNLRCEIAGTTAEHSVQYRLLDPAGSEVARARADNTGNNTATIDLTRPQRWSTEKPALYCLQTSLFQGDKEIDRLETRIGLRSIALNAQQGFVLNGESIKLKGFCMKEDHGPLGTAIPEKMWRQKLTMLRDLGCNAIRCGHYPFARCFYHICDELGFLVMDEFCDGWDQPKAAEDYGQDWHGNWQRDLTTMVRLHRNHPCVVFWSIGNEVHKQTDEKTECIVNYLRGLDHSRPIVMGRGYPACLDATCFNGQAEKPDVLEQLHANQPDRTVVLTETPHSYNTRGVYRTRAWLRDPGVPHFDIPNLTDQELFYYDSNRNHSSYDNASIRIGIRDCWQRTAEFDFVAGQFHWTFWDYAGESEYHGMNVQGDEPDGRFWPRGVVDMAMIRKDHSYYYESQFSDRPMVHLLPHWTHPELSEGTLVPVWAYSNGEEVELFLNGESLGRQAIPAYHNAAWDVPYQPGTLEAIAYRDGKEVARSQHTTATEPVALTLHPDHPSLEADRDDLTRIEVTACDASGVPVPWAMNTVALQASGPQRFLGAENGDRLDFTALRSSQRRLYFGKLAAFYGATDEAGAITVRAAAILGQRHGPAGRCAHIAVGHCSLRGAAANPTVNIYVTTDGSQPSTASTPYDASKGIAITADTTIKALICIDGEDGDGALIVSETFVIGERPIQAIQAGHNPDDDQAVDGVRDAEAEGWWINPLNSDRYEFRADGSVYRDTPVGIADRIGQWWYDYPNDRDEDPDDHGTGELVWGPRKRSPLAMRSRAADELLIGEVGKQWSLVRKE